MRPHVIEKFETRDTKITVEQRPDGIFISTYWNKEKEHEVDREVREFETFGGAVAEAFRNLSAYAQTLNFMVSLREKNI